MNNPLKRMRQKPAVRLTCKDCGNPYMGYTDYRGDRCDSCKRTRRKAYEAEYKAEHSTGAKQTDPFRHNNNCGLEIMYDPCDAPMKTGAVL